jgi:hypothetical protein
MSEGTARYLTGRLLRPSATGLGERAGEPAPFPLPLTALVLLALLVHVPGEVVMRWSLRWLCLTRRHRWGCGHRS